MSQDNQDYIANFLNKIDDWINNNRLDIKRINHEECELILNYSLDDLEQEDSIDLLKKGYILHGYADYLSAAYNKEKMIHDYAENSITYLLSSAFNNYGDQYTKWEVKYNSAVKENPLAKKLLQLKNNARARLTLLENKSEHIKKMADLMIELSRRKKNDYYSNS